MTLVNFAIDFTLILLGYKKNSISECIEKSKGGFIMGFTAGAIVGFGMSVYAIIIDVSI